MAGGKKRKRRGGGRWQVQRERCAIPDEAPPPASREAEPVEASLMRVVGALGIKEESLGDELVERWGQLVSGPVAQHTRPGRLEGARLVVYVDSSVWLAELARFGKRQLLRRIQEVWGVDRIQDLVLRPDPG